MKGLLKLTALAGGLFLLTACESSNGVYSGNDGRIYRAPDGGTYRRGDVYQDRNGNTYRNGDIYRYGNNNSNNSYKKRLPPGQAKKIYGGEARDYAPGHNKYNDNKGRKSGKHKGKGKHKH